MATQIGVITAVVGTVTATAEDGSIRTLQAGDRVYANEVISTGPAGAVEIEFADGSVMDLGRDSQAMLDSAVFNPNATELAESEGEAVPDDVAAIQQAILEGEDPTEAGEATAAGAGVEGSDGGHDAVFVNYLNPEVTPEAGFDTIGVNNTFDEIIDEQLIDGVPTAGLVTVLLDEDDLSFRSDEEIAQAINDFINGIEAEFLADTGFNLFDSPNAGVGDEGQPGDDLPSPNPTFFSGTLNADYGFNGPGSISFNPVVSQPAGLTSGGEPVQIWVSTDGLTLIGYVAGEGDFSPEISFQQEGPQFSGAEIIFSAQIDPATLNFTAGIYGPLDHPDTAEEGAFEENLLINMAFTITDADGDAAQGIIQLNVDDDSPVIGEQDYPQEQGEYSDFPYQMGVVDEDDTDDGVGNTDSPGDDSSTPYITLPINFGADGPAAENPVEISAEGIVDQSGNPLTSNGVEVQFSWNSSTNTLEGTADGQPVINIHVDVYDYGAGSYTEAKIELFDNLDHPIGAEGESLGTEDNLGITLNYTATDADGDQAYGSFDLSIDDDMPVIGTPEAVSVDEEGIDGNAGDSYDSGTTANGVLLMPELENGDLNSALDTDAKQAIKSFVEAGGQLVINGSYGSEDESLINDIFGFSITSGANTSSNVPTFSQTGAATGTDYESGPAQLNNPNGTYTWDISSLPAEATVMYSDGDDAAVVTIPVGDGQITFLAYDWYNAAPTGSQDGGWTDILDIAVSANGSPAEVSVFDNGSYVDTSSGGTSAESDNVQDTLQSQGHNVSTFTGITLTDILAALPEFTTGDLAGEDTVASGSLAINWGADNNNDDASEFDRSVVFTQQDAPEGLTADGEPVSYSISEDGTTLTAFTGEAGTDSYTEVFTVTLSDAGNGSYEFTLLGNLDHPEANTEDDIDLNFGFIATDSDGDAATGSFTVTVDDDAPVASGETVEFTVDEDDINTALSDGNQSNDGNSDGSFTGSPLTPFDNGPANVTGSVASLVSFGADGAGTFTLTDNFDALLAQNLTSKGEDLSFSVDGNVLTAEADGREVFTLTLQDDGEFTFELNDQLDHAAANGENNLPVDLSSVIVATDADGDAITLDSGFVINVTDDVPEEAGYFPEVGFVEEEALPGGNNEFDIPTLFGVDTVATGSVSGQVSVGADEPATFSLSGDYTSLIAQNLTSDGEPVTYSLDSNTLYAVAGETPVFSLTLQSNGNYTFTLVGPLDHAEGQGENLLPIDFSGIVIAEDADGDTLTLDQDFYITVIDDSPEAGYNPTVRLDDDALEGGNPGGPGDNTDSANTSGTLSHSFGADGGSISWLTSDAPNGFTYESDGDDLLVKQDGTTVLTLTLDPATGAYTVTQNAPLEHKDNGTNRENNQKFDIQYLVEDADGDTATGAIRVNVDDDTPTVEPYEVNTMRIISDDDTVAGLNGNPGEGTNTNDGAGTDSKEYNQSKTLQFSTGADGGTVAWNVDNSSVDDATAGISFSVNGDGSLIITQMQNGVPVQVAEITLDANTGDYTYTQTSNLLHTAGDNENEAAFSLGFTVTDGDGDTADGHLTLLIDDDTPVITSQQINLLTESFEDFAPDLSGNNWTVVGEGSGTIIGNNGIEWTVNGAGIEIQSGNAGGASASDGDVHAELDAHDSNGDGGSTLTQLSTEVELPTSEATLSFDFQPRPSDVDGSDMSVSLGGQTVNINVDGAGVIDFGSLPAGVTASQTSSAGGWTTITLTFTGLDTSSAQTLSFEGQGSANTLGAYIDNISLDAVASLTVDESALADGNGEAGASATASFDFSGFFTGAFGADGPADADSESYSLNLSGEDIASGLYAVDNTDTDAGDGDGYGQGAEILLNQVGDDIVGSVDGVDYFTISVDAETGEVTLTQHENIWHADTTNPDDSQGMVLDSELLTLVKTITDADEDSAEATLDLGGVSFNFEDDAPTIEAQQPAQPYLLTVTNEGGDAGYNNTYGFYIKGENGEPVSGEIIWANVKDNESDEITVEVTDPSDIGFFIIPDGADLNDLNNGDAVTFEQDGEGNWQVLLNGEPLTGQGTSVLFDNADLNPGNAEAVEDNAATGNQNWEDIIGGDNDFNDVNINVSINQLGAITVDETDIGNGDPSNATATLDLSGSFTADFGADGPGDIDYGLSVDTDVETGLVDTLSGKNVELRVNGDGVVEGYITTDDNMDLVVFTASVDDEGVVTLTQLRAVEHDDATDPDEANSPATLNAGAIALTGTVTDADGDSADGSIDVGVLFAFEDDGPVAADDVDSIDNGTAEGNVVTADSTDGEAGVDSYGADGAGSVTSVSFGDTTVEVPADGSVEIEGDYGTLAMHSDGSYTYTTNLDSLPQNTQTVEGWTNTGSNMTAFNLGESFLTADGKFSDTGSGTLTTGGNASGFGVAGTDAPNTNVPNQINYSGSQSEALAFKFDGTVTSATVQFSNMFQNENGGEAMRWHAFDADGNRIASGIVSDNENASDPYANTTSADFGGSNNIGSFTLSDIGAFTTLVFEGVPYSDDGSAGSDDSDFFVNVTSYEVFNSQDNAYQDEFGYTIVDGDGDSASATLTLHGNSEPQEGQLEPVAPVAADNTYQVDGVTSGNIITDDDNNGGAVSGRDYDNDTPVMNLSINSVIFNETETFITEDGTEIELDNGTLIINLDGSYTYTPAQDADGGDEFEYTLVDPDGQVSAPSLVTLLDADDEPTAGETFAFVDDEGLVPDGITGGTGDDVIADVDGDGNESTFAGTLNLDFGDDGAGSVDFASMNGETATVGTETVTFSWSAVDNTLTATGPRGDLFEVEVTDPNTGDYTLTLLDNVLHDSLNGLAGDDTENNTSVSLEYTVSDADGDPATGSLSIDFDDDTPAAAPDSVQAEEGSSETLGSDLVLMIDTSASVSSSQLASMKASLQNLFNSGSVHSVFITSFAEEGQFHDSGVDGGWYTNLGDAMTAINGLSSSGSGTYGTDYDAALEAVTDNFTAPPAGGDKLVSMFISDGEPNEHNGTYTTGIDGVEESRWIEFLEDNNFDNSYAVGYNGLDSSDIGFLEPVAWTEGESDTTHTGADDENVIILDSVEDLADTLTSTVTATPNPVTGNVLANDDAGAGADGFGTPALLDVTYDGNTVTFSDTTTSATFDTVAGEVVINSNGSYEFTGLSDTNTDVSAVINYTMQDADGDQASNNLTVSTQDSVPVAENDSDDIDEATWSIDGTESASVTVDGWSDAQSTTVNDDLQGWWFGPYNEVAIDPGYSADSDATGAYTVNADADHPATISAEVVIDNWRGGDDITVELLKDGLMIDSDDSFSGNGGSVQFEVTETGNYSLRIVGEDDRWWQGDLRAHLKDLRIDAYNYSSQTLNTTVNTAALAALAAATGNVLANDDEGADGGLSVTAVNGDAVSGSTNIDGLYGTLTIDENGDYTYTPNAEDLPAGMSDSFTYTVVDADGSEDTATLTIDINDHNYVVDDNDNVAVADAAGGTVNALDGDDVLIGSDQADTLNGGAGNDNLMGNDGDDTLIGGAGNDILTGGDGADIFQWNAGDEGTAGSPAVDFVTDFSSAEGDSLNLADLLQGEESANIADYISVAQNGSDVVIEVTPDGAGGDMNQVITLQDTTVDQLAGGIDTSGMSQADIINTLITNGQLNVDQS